MYATQGEWWSNGFLSVGVRNISIEYPGGTTQIFGTPVTGVNIVGTAGGVFDIQGSFNAMLWRDRRFYTINFPATPYSELHSINDRGDMTGAYCLTPDGQLLEDILRF